MAEREQTSSEDGASIELPLAKVPAAVDPIDLTGDESPRFSPSNRIDLTGETSLEEGLMNMMDGRPADIPQDADPVIIGVYAGNNPILVDSDDEDAHFSMDSDDQSEMIEDEASSENDSQYGVEESEPSDEEEDANDAEDSDMNDVQETSAIESIPPTNSNIRFALATHDNSTVRLSDIRTRIEQPEVFSDIDDESDFGLSEAGEAGIRALFEDGLLRHSYEDSYPILPGEALNEARPGSSFAAQAPKHISFTSSTSMQTSQDNTSGPGPNTTEYRRFQAAQNTIRHELQLPDPVARQPSPSDAAMVKGRMPARESSQIAVCDLGEFGRSVAQTLGEKTGKGDFFEAREINKAKFNIQNKTGQASGLTGMTSSTYTEPFEEVLPQMTATAPNPFERRVFGASQTSKPSTSLAFTFGESYYPSTPHKASSAVNKLSPADIACKPIIHGFQDSLLTVLDFPTREQCSFLDNPAHGPALDKAPSPEPYMTSAVNFNAATQKPRSGLGINDIINTASTTTQSLKRKAEDISDVTDAELRSWAQSSTASNGNLKGSVDMSESEEQAAVASPVTVVVPTVPDALAPRPTKKLRKLLENVGYVALGGVAVGAGLFSVLVATAPDFL